MTDENTSPLVGSWGPGKNSGGQCWGSLWKRLTVMVGPLEARPKTRSGTCYTRWATRLRPWRLLPWRTFLLSAHQRVWDFFFYSFPGKSLKVLKILSILKQTQGSKWLRLKEFASIGLIWQSKCPKKAKLSSMVPSFWPSHLNSCGMRQLKGEQNQ